MTFFLFLFLPRVGYVLKEILKSFCRILSKYRYFIHMIHALFMYAVYVSDGGFFKQLEGEAAAGGFTCKALASRRLVLSAVLCSCFFSQPPHSPERGRRPKPVGVAASITRHFWARANLSTSGRKSPETLVNSRFFFSLLGENSPNSFWASVGRAFHFWANLKNVVKTLDILTTM